MSPSMLPAGIGWVQVQDWGHRGAQQPLRLMQAGQKTTQQNLPALAGSSTWELTWTILLLGCSDWRAILTPTDSHLHAVPRGCKLQYFETFCRYFIWTSCGWAWDCLTETMGLLNCLELAIIGIAWMEGFNKLRKVKGDCVKGCWQILEDFESFSY